MLLVILIKDMLIKPFYSSYFYRYFSVKFLPFHVQNIFNLSLRFNVGDLCLLLYAYI